MRHGSREKFPLSPKATKEENDEKAEVEENVAALTLKHHHKKEVESHSHLKPPKDHKG